LQQEHSARLDTEGRRHLDRIIAAAGHMNELIEGLLQLAKVSHQALYSETVDLQSLVKRIIRSLQEREPERQIEIVCTNLPTVRGDERLLSIALHNLLENAWKYTSRTALPRVEVSCQDEPDRAVFYVRDNGAGFDMQFAEHLFEPFRRLHSAKEFSGTGIGLATVARVVERHGGHIWAQAALGEGATFYFTLAPRSVRESFDGRNAQRREPERIAS
jgi:light-regulated signal transduction histidine kinase (bacteriophytochrome)